MNKRGKLKEEFRENKETLKREIKERRKRKPRERG